MSNWKIFTCLITVIILGPLWVVGFIIGWTGRAFTNGIKDGYNV